MNSWAIRSYAGVNSDKRYTCELLKWDITSMSFLLLVVQSPRQATNFLTILGQKEAEICWSNTIPVLVSYFHKKERVRKKLVRSILLPQYLLLKSYQRNGNCYSITWCWGFITFFDSMATYHQSPWAKRVTKTLAYTPKLETNWASYN